MEFDTIMEPDFFQTANNSEVLEFFMKLYH